MSRIWPESTASWILSIAASHSSLVASAGSMPSALSTSGTVSRSSSSSVTLPLYLGSKRSLIEVMSGARSRAHDEAGHAAGPGIEKLRPGSNSGSCRLGEEVLVDVRDRLVVDLLEVAEVVVAAGHPVGGDDDVAAAGVAVLEVGAQLGQEGLVRVDVLEVVHVDAGGVLELGDRAALALDAALALVDVERAGGHRELALDRAVLGDLDVGVVALVAAEIAAARGEAQGSRAHRRRQGQSDRNPTHGVSSNT